MKFLDYLDQYRILENDGKSKTGFKSDCVFLSYDFSTYDLSDKDKINYSYETPLYFELLCLMKHVRENGNKSILHYSFDNILNIMKSQAKHSTYDYNSIVKIIRYARKGFSSKQLMKIITNLVKREAIVNYAIALHRGTSYVEENKLGSAQKSSLNKFVLLNAEKFKACLAKQYYGLGIFVNFKKLIRLSELVSNDEVSKEDLLEFKPLLEKYISQLGIEPKALSIKFRSKYYAKKIG